VVFFIIILFTICGLGIFQLIKNPEKFFLYPYTIIYIFTVFICPQVIALVNSYYAGESIFLSKDAIIRVLIMAILCIAMSFIGFYYKPKEKYLNRNLLIINENAASKLFILYVIIGFYFYYKISTLPLEIRESPWTGIITVYHFFSQLYIIGLIGLSILRLRKTTLMRNVFFISSLILLTYTVIFLGRRSPAFTLFLIVIFSLYFVRKYKPSKIIIISFIAISALVNVSVEEYRSIAYENQRVKNKFPALSKVPYLKNFLYYLEGYGVLELRNAAYLAEYSVSTGNYGLGRHIWNTLIDRYIPAQFTGLEFKQSLQFRSDLREDLKEGLGYNIPTGTTLTGIGDSFYEFGYFGSLLFLLIALIMRFFWEMAYTKQSTYHQFFYIFALTISVNSVTNQISNFLPGIIYISIFLYPIILTSKRIGKK